MQYAQQEPRSMPYMNRAHDALSIVFYLHAGYLQSFEYDERRRILRGHELIEAMEYLLESHYNTLWRSTRGEPTRDDFVRCELATLPHLQETLACLLRLVPSYIAIPLRVIPSTSWSAEETLGVFRDEIDLRMEAHDMAVVFL